MHGCLLFEFIRRKIVALNEHDMLAFISQVYLYIEQYNQIQGIQVRRVDESESPLKEWPFYVVQRRYKLGATDKFSNLPAPWVSREDQHDAIRDTKVKT